MDSEEREAKKSTKKINKPIKMTEVQNNFHFNQSPTYNNYFDSVKATYLNTPNNRVVDFASNQQECNEADRQPKIMKNSMILTLTV